MAHSRRWKVLCSPSVVIAAVGLTVVPCSASAGRQHDDFRLPVPSCASLTTDSAFGLRENPLLKSVTSTLAATAAPASVPYCRVTMVYGLSAEQNITIAVGLPLSPVDGGSGGVVGAWNGRTEGLGGGVCTGTLNVDAAVDAGYASSGTDGGHPIGPSAAIGDCATWVKPDGTYDIQHIDDFFRNGIKQQILWSKLVAHAYYGIHPSYNYWNGCSTGGRQGYLLAQELGDELDGILANAPAIYWTRFATAQAWGQISMFELAGESPPGAIAPAKLAAAGQAAVTACDANDGVADGIIDDPRTCSYDAKNAVCGLSSAPATPNCLTAAEASALNKLWDGPRNNDGNRIWFPLDRGTDFNGLNGPVVFPFVQIQFEWNEKDQSYAYPLVGPGLFPTSTKWNTVTLTGANNTLSYAHVAQDGSRRIADVTDTFGNLDQFRRAGGKLLTFVGANDQLIHPRGVVNYYRQMAARYDDRKNRDIDFRAVQRFYRLFRAPGVAHCGGGAGPQPQGLFNELVTWVETGKAPEQILATNTTNGIVTRSRPLCPYPKTAIYSGSGDPNQAGSFYCGGNLETSKTACNDVLVRYKHEVNGDLDFRGTAVSRFECLKADHN